MDQLYKSNRENFCGDGKIFFLENIKNTIYNFIKFHKENKKIIRIQLKNFAGRFWL